MTPDAPPSAWGWCPSILRPMPLDDGLMIRIRAPLTRISAAQAAGLAKLAARFGAGVIELTSRANLQLRGLTEADHRALVPELDTLGLTAIDRTDSARVNVTLSPFHCPGDGQLHAAMMLSAALAEAEWAALPEKFGFVIDAGPSRVLADTPGDIRIEASAEGSLILRADGRAFGQPVVTPEDAVAGALTLARWFLRAGGVGADGRGRMAQLTADLPTDLQGDTTPAVPAQPPVPDGPGWIIAKGGRLAPETLRNALRPGVTDLRLTPFRALYLPELATAPERDNKAATAMGRDGANAV